MKFRTTAPHYLPGDLLVEADTEIGEGTRYPLPKDYVPSRAMVPLDGAAKSAMKKAGYEMADDGENVFAAKGKAGKPSAPIEDAPGVPHKPWVGAVGPEGGPTIDGVEGKAAGYDEVDPGKLRGHTGQRASLIEEPSDAKATRAARTARVENPNEELAPRDVSSESKAGNDVSGRSGQKKTL